MLKRIQKIALTLAALAALALGGSALAGAASNTSTTTGTTTTPSAPNGHPPRGDRTPLSADVAAKVKQAALDKVPGATVLRTEAGGPGGHRRPGGPGAGETPLTGDTKSSVEAAVLDKYPGATIERTETNNGPDAPYESHVTTKDAKQLEVLVSKDFAVVAANEHP